MRLIATTVACVLAAFGAAFLVGRAANNHQGSATAATVTVRAASRPAPATTVRVNRALAAQFEPGLHGLRRPPEVHRRHVVHHHAAPATPAPVVTSAPAPTQTVAPAPTPAPVYRAPPAASTPHHRSGGSGTTTIG